MINVIPNVPPTLISKNGKFLFEWETTDEECDVYKMEIHWDVSTKIYQRTIKITFEHLKGLLNMLN